MKQRLSRGTLEACLDIALSASDKSPFWTPAQREGAHFLAKTIRQAFKLSGADQ